MTVELASAAQHAHARKVIAQAQLRQGSGNFPSYIPPRFLLAWWDSSTLADETQHIPTSFPTVESRRNAAPSSIPLGSLHVPPRIPPSVPIGGNPRSPIGNGLFALPFLLHACRNLAKQPICCKLTPESSRHHGRNNWHARSGRPERRWRH